MAHFPLGLLCCSAAPQTLGTGAFGCVNLVHDMKVRRQSLGVSSSQFAQLCPVVAAQGPNRQGSILLMWVARCLHYPEASHYTDFYLLPVAATQVSLATCAHRREHRSHSL